MIRDQNQRKRKGKQMKVESFVFKINMFLFDLLIKVNMQRNCKSL